ncbi:MAG TPA: hypothetical protein VEG64_12065 [Candidatus Sulfotelmatobacter sp.]|nr:hypothetical protein [Candidatus Sulfotelmatobacter sp.]
MEFRLTLVLAAMALCADVRDIARFRMPLLSEPDLSPLSSSGSRPDVFMTVGQRGASQSAGLQQQSRIEIIRYVSGEFAKVVKPLPGGKKGFKIPIGKTIDDKIFQNTLRFQGIAASPGDTVQITNIEFRGKEIVVQVNGGGKKKFHLREHLQVGVGPTTPAPIPVDSKEGMGATLILDYGRDLPDMSPEDLMHDLSFFLDFSKEHSAAVNWVDTLPPQFKEAIKERQAVVGMDHEMVLAAMGRPDHKVREKDPNGDQTEDWIYGTPPAKTVFVTFQGDKVVRVKEYN